MIQGLIVLNNPDYVPERWQGTLLFYAVIAAALIFNTYLVKYLPKIEGLILIIHIVGFFGILIPLVYMAPHGSAADVFTTFGNAGGWSSNGLAFFVGLVTGVYSFLGTSSLVVFLLNESDHGATKGADSACHMGESLQLFA